VLEAPLLSLECSSSERRILSRGKPIPKTDACIPRLGASSDIIAMSFVRQFEEMGVYCLNSSRSICIARDKLATMQLLSYHGINIPPSALVLHREDIAPTVARLGGPPIILKLIEGTQGIGVMLAESVKAAEAIFETMQVNGQHVLFQKFIGESRGRDIRAFVLGNRVIAAMRRSARNDEFRSNFHRGGSVEKVTLEPDYEDAAVKAASLLGLDVAGVDILESNEGPKVMELNASPGLEGIEGATNVNIARAIIEYVEERAGSV
jgi:ribosomal protein S6--L-glutamate ligase